MGTEDSSTNKSRVVDLSAARTAKLETMDTLEGAEFRHPGRAGRRLAAERKARDEGQSAG
jgi:hypothetical protein